MAFSAIKRLAVFIYDLIISFFLTIPAHLMMVQHMTLLNGTFLDVGCGTGSPLQSILPGLKKTYKKIVGVDLNKQYSDKAKEIFRNDLQVNIYQMDFYRLQKQLAQKFNFILFSFSFMLMPDKVQAMQVAKRSLNKDGRIAFILSLNNKQNKFLQKIKPIIRKLTTIDFGEVVYDKQFQQLLKIGNLQIVKKVRISSPKNLVLKIAPVYYVQTVIRKQNYSA